MKNSVTLELDVRSAAAVRECLFKDTKLYTYGEGCPARIEDLRSIITTLDEKIEEELTKVARELTEVEKQAPDYGVGK